MPPFGGGVADAARRYLSRHQGWVELTALGAEVPPLTAPAPMRAGGLVRPLSIAEGLPGAYAPGEPNAVYRCCTRFGAVLPIILPLVKMRRAQYVASGRLRLQEFIPEPAVK